MVLSSGMSISPVLYPPAALRGQAGQAVVRVHGHRFVCPFEHRGVACMVGIEADVTAMEPAFAEPVGDHAKLGRAITILAIDLGVDAIVEADNRASANDIVEAEF